ncbi:MAG: hypothetical protein COA58_01215 [Bacteroidetes bacterium]|nr:MAG: hypothetical protein COA58_01215 [Bacteroidota bacterium]
MKRTIIITFIWGVATLFSSAQTWTKLNLPVTDQTFTDIKVGADGNIYLLSGMGLFKSSDDGTNWSIYNNGSRNSDGSIGDELMTISENGLVFIDKGLTINQVNATELKRTEYYTLGGYQRSAQMVSLSTGEIVMAHRSNWGNKDVSYKISSNGGVSFVDKKTSSGFLLKNYKNPILFSNENDDVYYVGEDYTLYRSTDKGESFTSSGTAFEGDYKTSTIDKKTGAIYGLVSKSAKWSLKKTTDHGVTWTTLTLPGTILASVVAYDNQVICYAYNKCYHSTDGGANWTDRSSMFSSDNFPSKYVITQNGKVVGINSGSHGVVGLDFSTNTVTQSNSGIVHGSSSTHSFNGTRLAATFSGQAYYTDNNGADWTRLKGEGAYGNGLYVAKNGTVYVASVKSGIFNGVYKQDANDSMVAVIADVDEVGNMSKTNSMFEDDKGNFYCVSSLYGLYKSSDGMNFTRLVKEPFNNLGDQTVWFSESNKRMYGFNSTGGDIHYSDDYGVTWTLGTKVTDQNFPQYIQFKGASKVWTHMWSTKVAQHGFYSSGDVGTWSHFPTTVAFDNRYNQIIKGDNPAYIYDASTKGYVSMSTDTGKTWIQFEDGLDSFAILDRTEVTAVFVPVVRMTSGGGKLVLSTSGALYMADQVAGSSTGIVTKVNAASHTIYPNPANNILHINGAKNIERIVILNAVGQSVHLEVLKSNSIDFSNLENGIYFLRIHSEQGLSSHRVVIQH